MLCKFCFNGNWATNMSLGQHQRQCKSNPLNNQDNLDISEFTCCFCPEPRKIWWSRYSCAQHKIRCKFNVNRKPTLLKNHPDALINLAKIKDKKYGEVIRKTVSCEYCKSVFSYMEREFIDNHTKFCSRSCSGHRKLSEATKNKIRAAITGKKYPKKYVWVMEKLPRKLYQCGFCWGGIRKIASDKNDSKLHFCNHEHHRNFLKTNISYKSILGKKISATRIERINDGTIVNPNGWGGKTKWFRYVNWEKNATVQGSFEYRTCIILDKQKEQGIIIDWEYTSDRFCYVDENGKSRNYLLDFKVYDNTGGFFYLEVKWFKKLVDEYKWSSVRNQGYTLNIWFQKDIRLLEQSLWINKDKWVQELREQWWNRWY